MNALPRLVDVNAILVFLFLGVDEVLDRRRVINKRLQLVRRYLQKVADHRHSESQYKNT